ncbi:glycosyltransferase [Chloroflexota bacterium]
MTETYSPLVSIIIPSYNCRAWVCEAIDSALAQTYPACEVIVVDDGSTDGTQALLTEKYDDRIRYYCQRNRGLAGARNTGLSLAKGKYVQFLDSDDILLSEKVAVQVGFLEDAPEYSVAYSDFSYFSDDRPGVRRLPESSKYRDRYCSGDIRHSLLEGNYLVCHAALARLADVRDVGGFDETLSGCADYDLWLRMAYQGCWFACTDQVLVLYRQTSGSMSSNRTKQTLETIRVLEKIRTYASLDGKEEHQRYYRYLTNVHLGMASALLDEDDRLKAMSHLLQAAKCAAMFVVG